MRKVALKALPLLVVLWAAFIIFGGALRLVEKAEPTEGSAVETVAGFCAAFVALAASAYVALVAGGLGFFVRRTLGKISNPCSAPSRRLTVCRPRPVLPSFISFRCCVPRSRSLTGST